MCSFPSGARRLWKDDGGESTLIDRMGLGQLPQQWLSHGPDPGSSPVEITADDQPPTPVVQS